MNLSKNPNYQKMAYVLTGLCIASTMVLILFLIFGPKEGMEAMIILFPWFLAGAVHVVLGLATLFCVWQSGAFLKNAWILIYFMLFFGVNSYTLAVINEVDKVIVRGIHTITKPEQEELYGILRSMKVGSSGRYQLSPSAAARAHDLVQKGVDVSYISPGYHRTMLLMATLANDPVLVRLMLKQGALVDGRDATPYTPLAAAVSNGSSQVVKVLLDNGAAPNSPIYRAYPPLIIAAKQGDTAVTELLLKAGAFPDAITSSSQPALTLAAGNNFPQVVKLLLEFGADPNIVGFGGSTPLLRAVTSNCVACVHHLLEAGADGSGRMSDGETPLALALQNNNREIINILGKGTTRIGSWDELFYAVNKTDTQLLETMLEFGIDPNSRDEKGNTVLIYIAHKNKYKQKLQQAAPEIARILLVHDADPDITGNNHTTALFWAARTGNRTVAEILIINGADVNIADKDGQTPLLVAIRNKHNDIANELLAAGADPNLQAVWGMNKDYPLRAATQQNNPEMIKQLFENGVAIDPTSRDLCDLIQYGAQSPEVIRIIAESGVELNHRDPLHRYPLSVLVRNGHPESIAYLLEKGAEPLLPDWKGMQPFMHFVRNNQADLVAASIETSQALRENEKQMRDGMYWAVRSAHPEVVKVLLEEGTFFQRIESVEALLKWAKTPPATEADKQEIMRLFTERFKTE